jgi:hypothetical protein
MALGHKNVWNTKHHRTKLLLIMFSAELKPVANNKNIFNVEYTYKYTTV